jgi:hypothetical protein
MSDSEDGSTVTPPQSRRIPLRQNRRSSAKQNGVANSPGLNANDDEAEKSARRVHRRSTGTNKKNRENDDGEDSNERAADDYSESPAGKAKGKLVQKARTSDANVQKTKTGTKSRLSVVNRPVAVVTTTSASATVVSGTTVNGGTMLNLGDVSQVPVQVPRKTMDDNFEEWMKMATDNVSGGASCSWRKNRV